MLRGAPGHLYQALCKFPNLTELNTSLETLSRIPTHHKPLDMPHLTSLTYNVGRWPDVGASIVAKAPQLCTLAITGPARRYSMGADNHSKIFCSQTIRTLHAGLQSWEYITSNGRLGTDFLPNLERLSLTANVSGPSGSKVLKSSFALELYHNIPISACSIWRSVPLKHWEGRPPGSINSSPGCLRHSPGYPTQAIPCPLLSG